MHAGRVRVANGTLCARRRATMARETTRSGIMRTPGITISHRRAWPLTTSMGGGAD